MAEQGTITIKVESGTLRTIAEEVEGKIGKMETALQIIEGIVQGSSRYWEGKGVEAHMRTYHEKTETITLALQRFRENVTDLRMIAGIYEIAESENVSDMTGLQTNLII